MALARLERRVLQNVRDERDVGLDAADVLLADRAQRLAAQALERLVVAGDLDQQRIVIRRDLRADIGIAAVQTHAVAARGTVGRDLADVRQEVVLGVLGRDAALHRIAARDHIRLLADADFLVKQRIAFGNQDLRAHQIHAGQLLGDRVLDLDARVHLDEVVIARFVDQELDRARGHIAHMPRDLDRVRIQLCAQLLGHAPRGRELHDLLIAALERAVALEQVDDIAVPVAQHLHLDVLGLDEEFLDEDILVTERLLRLALDLQEVDADILRAVAAAHAAAAAAPGRLEQHRVAELLRERDGVVHIGQRASRAGDGGHAALLRDGLGGQLVAHLLQNPGRRADERDARLLAGAGKRRVLRQEAIAGMDRVHAAALRQVNDPRDVQIRCQRAFVFADQVGLVRARAVQAVCILLRIDGYCAQVQVIARAENAQRDLPAVGDQHLVKLADFQMASVLSVQKKYHSVDNNIIPFSRAVSNSSPVSCTKVPIYGRMQRAHTRCIPSHGFRYKGKRLFPGGYRPSPLG